MGIFILTDFFLEALFFALALVDFGSSAALLVAVRAVDSALWPLVSFPVSIFGFLAKVQCLRLRAKSTPETALASGFCKPFARAERHRVPYRYATFCFSLDHHDSGSDDHASLC